MRTIRACVQIFVPLALTVASVFPQEFSAKQQQKRKPNVILIVADDMGSNDVGFHGSNEIPTPNIDALAYNGVILNQHYTQALCTPSRAALMTGKYPIHLGMQHLVILEPEPWGVPLNETFLPEHFKRNGYKTHAVGKWHLGFCKKEYTPTYRGFDTHFGYWQGLQDYYRHTVHATYGTEYGYDMRRNMSVDWDAQGKYSTTLFTDEAVRLIKEHNTDNPMFMYFAHLAPHTGNDDDPLQAPDEEIAKFSHIKDPERRVYAAMVSMLDKSVGSVINALREKHMLENSIIIFMSDNGAMTEGTHANVGSNYPLRGMKNSPWEGAMRNIAAIWSPLIKSPQRVSNELIHISDWLPTLISAAGLEVEEVSEIDGIDVWDSISGNEKEDVSSSSHRRNGGSRHRRNQLVYNVDDVWNYTAIRRDDWKYIVGNTYKGKYSSWYGSNGSDPNYSYSQSSILLSPAGVALNAVNTYEQIKNKHSNRTVKLLSLETINRLRDAATIKCPPTTTTTQDKCIETPCLFNLHNDPCETTNLASFRQDIVAMMENLLAETKKTMRKPINVQADPRANPLFHNGTWTNWLDYLDNEEISGMGIVSRSLEGAIWGIVAGAVALLVIIAVYFSIRRKSQKKHIEQYKSVEMQYVTNAKRKQETDTSCDYTVVTCDPSET